MELSPGLAATLADGVYGVIDRRNVRQAVAAQIGNLDTLDDAFDVSGATVAGVSGGAMLGRKTGFGMVLQGKGRQDGNVAVVVRGTDTLSDWLSNANVAYDTGPGGFPVHAGFCRIYESMRDDITAALRGRNPSQIHVVGHSLGGAVANLFAAQFLEEKRGDVRLYTFGAPRPGHGAFARYLSAELSQSQLRRVYCAADPVQLVPTWPFMHAPLMQPGLRSPHGGSLMSIEAHRIPSYRNALDTYSWRQMQAAQVGTNYCDSFEFWISQAMGHGPAVMSATVFWALSRALNALFRTIAVGLVLVGIPTLSAIDRLAAMAFSAAQRSPEVKQNLLQVLMGFGRFLGYAIVDGISLTAALISHVLASVYGVLARLAQAALARPA